MAHTSNLAGTSRTDYTELVNCLAIKHRKKEALRCLMAGGFDTASALRAGLKDDNPDVRVGCCMVLDHFMIEAAVPELIENLTHSDSSVRAWAIHTLACDRCKQGVCRPGEGDTVPMAIRMLQQDPSKGVRQMAAGMLGPSVHRSTDALVALQKAHNEDPSPVVRKIAGWWIPGGICYNKLKPRTPRRL
ncbi:MAG: HEAT repeat domain-containing protein [bacterium]|nr:HEAT repeat domain-containing protein [Gammaproteobacteria bacterium]